MAGAPMSNVSDCCGSPCMCAGTAGEPCYGEVVCVGEEQFGDDDWAWIHACEGHYWWPKGYVPQVKS
jgi:hypothetical protein